MSEGEARCACSWTRTSSYGLYATHFRRDNSPRMDQTGRFLRAMRRPKAGCATLLVDAKAYGEQAWGSGPGISEVGQNPEVLAEPPHDDDFAVRAFVLDAQVLRLAGNARDVWWNLKRKGFWRMWQIAQIPGIPSCGSY